MSPETTHSSLSLCVFDDPSTTQLWKANVEDIDGKILCVSQFALMVNTTKGNKPEFHLAVASRYIVHVTEAYVLDI